MWCMCVYTVYAVCKNKLKFEVTVSSIHLTCISQWCLYYSVAVIYWTPKNLECTSLSPDGNSNVVGNHIVKVLIHLVPVHNIPPVGNILRSPVLVLQIISMFPNIQSQNRKHDLITHTLHKRVVLIGRSDNLDLVSLEVDREPHPSTSEYCAGGGLGLEFGLHFVEGSEGFVNHGREFFGRFGFGCFVVGSHLVPEESCLRKGKRTNCPLVKRRNGKTNTQYTIHNPKNIFRTHLSYNVMLKQTYHGCNVLHHCSLQG